MGSKEYSLELLLSYIEMDQFQKHTLRTIDAMLKSGTGQSDNTDPDMVPDITVMNTMRNVPKSRILTMVDASQSDHELSVDEKTMRKVKRMAHLLHNKYIKEGSEFEINICWSSRSKLMGKLGNLDELLSDNQVRLSHLVNLYQEPKEEMKQLLNFSLSRLKHSPEADALYAMIMGSGSRSPSAIWKE